MFVVTLDGVEYHTSGSRLTQRSIRTAKAEAVGLAVQRKQQITKATKITVEWVSQSLVTPDSISTP
ncbi:hypothetical protein LC607_07245 [Nostoc sp. CHAB 5824]|nr:hypothetical protein [Nostoc sp. CHAB 5824]